MTPFIEHAFQQPAVSVVIPVFNRLEYLRPAIESVFSQTLPHWELLIADDGSDEETREYLTTLESPPRVKNYLAGAHGKSRRRTQRRPARGHGRICRLPGFLMMYGCR